MANPQPTNNPRDHLVTMIAITSGEEGFTDSNANGQYDDGEPFDDLTEPFVDSNDNGTWDTGEQFIDVNANGKWDGKNGKWDANSLIWVSERITWTATPAGQDLEDTASPIFKAVGYTPNQACDGTSGAAATLTPCINNLSSIQAAFVMSDPWFNGIAQNGDGDGCSLVPPDEMPPVTASPKVVDKGRLFTYPPVIGFVVTIKDARDPNAPPEDQVPIRNPPIRWTTPVQCNFTSSPEQGFQLVLTLDTISGYVQ